MARGSRCAGFDSGRGRFAAPLFLNGFVVPLKGSFPLKHRSCYQGRTQHSGYSRVVTRVSFKTGSFERCSGG